MIFLNVTHPPTHPPNTPKWFGDSTGTCFRGLSLFTFLQQQHSSKAAVVTRKVSNQQRLGKISPVKLLTDVLPPSLSDRERERLVWGVTYRRVNYFTDELLSLDEEPTIDERLTDNCDSDRGRNQPGLTHRAPLNTPPPLHPLPSFLLAN